MTDGQTLLIERTFKAPIEAVFDAFTNEEVMLRWWHAKREWTTTAATVDLRIGGEVRVVMTDPEVGEDYGGGGVYTEIDRPNRLAFTWIWDRDTRGTLIEIDFAESNGATSVRFKHSKLWDEETVRSHEEGWSGALENLRREIEAG